MIDSFFNRDSFNHFKMRSSRYFRDIEFGNLFIIELSLMKLKDKDASIQFCPQKLEPFNCAMMPNQLQFLNLKQSQEQVKQNGKSQHEEEQLILQVLQKMLKNKGSKEMLGDIQSILSKEYFQTSMNVKDSQFHIRQLSKNQNNLNSFQQPNIQLNQSKQKSTIINKHAYLLNQLEQWDYIEQSLEFKLQPDSLQTTQFKTIKNNSTLCYQLQSAFLSTKEKSIEKQQQQEISQQQNSNCTFVLSAISQWNKPFVVQQQKQLDYLDQIYQSQDINPENQIVFYLETQVKDINTQLNQLLTIFQLDRPQYLISIKNETYDGTIYYCASVSLNISKKCQQFFSRQVYTASATSFSVQIAQSEARKRLLILVYSQSELFENYQQLLHQFK